jgi:hypothetical protein
MKKLRTSLIILSVATLQGCCCGGGGLIPSDRERYYRTSYDVIASASDEYVCETAIDGVTKWHDSKALSAWVKEAKDRNLTLDNCRKIIFEAATDEKVCRLAVAKNGKWETIDHRIRWTNEAKHRGFTPETCTQIMLAEQSSKKICMFAVQNEEWAVENLQFVNEAKRRGLSPAKCKFFHRP